MHGLRYWEVDFGEVPSDGQFVRCIECGKIHIRMHGLYNIGWPMCMDCREPLTFCDAIRNGEYVERMHYELESGEPG